MEGTSGVVEPGLPPPPAAMEGPPRRPRRAFWVVAGVIVAVIAVLAVFLVREMNQRALPPPTFPSLQQAPDSSLHGTVAYLSGSEKHVGAEGKPGTETWCVRVVAAAGSPARNALCIPSADLEGMVGPQLRWRSDNRLEVTMFRSTGKGSTGPGWQRLVDVRTGEVEDVPASAVPAAPAEAADPSVGPNGEQLTTSQKGGHVEVVLTTSTGSRTVFSATGNPDYGISLGGWSPDGTWFLVDDGRLLLVTTDDPGRTRVLVDDPAAYGDVAGAGIKTFALTGTDVLGAGG